MLVTSVGFNLIYTFFRLKPQAVFLLGDYNCYHVMCGSDWCDWNGKSLANPIMVNNLLVFNNGSYTRFAKQVSSRSGDLFTWSSTKLNEIHFNTLCKVISAMYIFHQVRDVNQNVTPHTKRNFYERKLKRFVFAILPWQSFEKKCSELFL